MSIFELIPTCDDPMSQYTCIGFLIYTGVLVLLAKCCMKRLDKQDKDTNGTRDTINDMQIDIAVMAESLKNIETDGTETRTAIAEINRTLLDKLT